MPRSMSLEEVRVFLEQKPGWVAFSSIDPGGTPHTVPLGYFCSGDELLMGVGDGTAKVRNVERDSRASAMVENGKTFDDIKGVLIQGRAFIHRDPTEVLAYMQEGARQRGSAAENLPRDARPGAVFIRLTPERILSWDYGS